LLLKRRKSSSLFPKKGFLAQYCVRRAKPFIPSLKRYYFMKSKFLLVVAAFVFSISLNAQSTVDSIAAKYKLLPMPEPFTIEKAFPVLGSYQLVTNNNLSANQTSVNTEATNVTLNEQPTSNVSVYLDEESKGIIWVEGLPEGKFKAYLKKSPSTYRIISQKTETGVQIPEGTLIFDPEANVLNIALGKEFNDEEPTAVFATANSETVSVEQTTAKNTKAKKAPAKAKVKLYTATKVGAGERAEPSDNQSSSFEETLNKSIEQLQ
jgi:hypothetical protein